jgi:hypothetical protein
MKYYKTYTFTAVFILIVFSGFIGMLFFWSDPQSAGAMQTESPVLQKAVTKQTLNNNNCVSTANYVAFESISDKVYSKDSESESFLAQNPPSKDVVVESNSGDTGSSTGSTSDSLDTESSTTLVQSDSVSSDVVSSDATLSKSGSSGTAGGAAAAGNASSSGAGGSDSSGGGRKVTDSKWKWVYVECNFVVENDVTSVQGAIRQAAAAGYNGVVLADVKFENLQSQASFYFQNVRKIKELADELGIEIIPRIFNLGYPDVLLANDVTLAESMPVTEMALKVSNKKAVISESDNLLKDCPFDETLQGRPIGWDSYDAFGRSLHIDYTVYHSGGASYRFDNFDEAPYHQVRLMKKIVMKPFRQYRVSTDIKTEDVENPEVIAVYVVGAGDRHICFARFAGIAKTQDWTQYSIVFNSQDLSGAQFYIGGWAVKAGRFWMDNIKIEECLGVNLVRRQGCPVKVTDQSGQIEYTEGEDYESWSFPKLGNFKWPGTYHTDAADNPIIITKNSKIKEGQIIKASYYHAPVVGTNQVGICLTHEKTYGLLKEEIKQINKLFNPRKVLIGCDEMRVIGQCGLCRARKQTSGAILADTIKKCKAIITQELPDAEIFVWSDMFDLYDNAGKDNYYYCRGSLKGSWEGIDSDIRIVDWNFGQCEKSLSFFNAKGNRIVIADFYDRADARAEMGRWLKAVDTLSGPKVEGFLYTTWQKDYSKMSDYQKILVEKGLSK